MYDMYIFTQNDTYIWKIILFKGETHLSQRSITLLVSHLNQECSPVNKLLQIYEDSIPGSNHVLFNVSENSFFNV